MSLYTSVLYVLIAALTSLRPDMLLSLLCPVQHFPVLDNCFFFGIV